MRSQLVRHLLGRRTLSEGVTRISNAAGALRVSKMWNSGGGSTPSRRDIRMGLDELDDPFTKGKQKKKASLPLEEEEEPLFTESSGDAAEAIAADYVDALNDVLADKSLLHIFKGFRLPSQLCEVMDVQFDRQQSHIIAFWKSDFVDKLKRESGEDSERFARTADKIAKHISDTLNKHEGRVRTALMQRGSFRRVPRVEFRPISAKKVDYLSPARISKLLDSIQDT